jgi:transposase InsO family protein
MRYAASEKLEIIRLVEESACPCDGRWKRLAFRAPPSTAGTICTDFVSLKPWTTEILSRIASGTAFPFFVMKAAAEFSNKTTAPNQLWQTNFTYLKVIGWGWFYLSTVLDDFSRYIIAWKLCTTMKAEDVAATLEMALDAAGLAKASVLHRPRLLSDNGSSYMSDDLAKWLERHDMAHVRGAPYHPMTQGKIERWHQTLKNRIQLETITCRAIWKPRSRPSWPTTTTAAITRASVI